MKTVRPLPPLEELREFLSYDWRTGIFYWLKRPAKNVQVGDVAGCFDKSTGYHKIQLNKCAYKTHRLAWLFITGNDPGELQIDHRDHDESNNAADNLRLANSSQNGMNRRQVKGCRLKKSTNRWEAQITVGKKQIYIGCYDTFEDANRNYLTMKSILHGGFCPA